MKVAEIHAQVVEFFLQVDAIAQPSILILVV